ncbi:hypothetical protein YC2023_075974 [Brassica napus]
MSGLKTSPLKVKRTLNNRKNYLSGQSKDNRLFMITQTQPNSETYAAQQINRHITLRSMNYCAPLVSGQWLISQSTNFLYLQMSIKDIINLNVKKSPQLVTCKLSSPGTGTGTGNWDGSGDGKHQT